MTNKKDGKMSDYKQTRDAAGKVTTQYSKMLRNLDDDDLVERLRTGNTNHIDADLWMMEAAALIEELEAQIKNDALQYLSDTGQMGEAVGDLTRRHQHALHKIDVLEDEIDVLKAKLADAERRERQLLDTTATCRMLRRELNTAKAKLAEVDAERDAFASNIPDAAQNLIRNAHTGRLKALHRAVVVEAELAEVEEERDDALIALASARKQLELYIEEGSVMGQKLDAAEGRIAHLESHIEATAKDTHKIMLQYEAALPAVYRLAMGDAARRVEAKGAENPSSTGQYANSAFVIRRLPTPTADELMARIQTGEKE